MERIFILIESNRFILGRRRILYRGNLRIIIGLVNADVAILSNSITISFARRYFFGKCRMNTISAIMYIKLTHNFFLFYRFLTSDVVQREQLSQSTKVQRVKLGFLGERVLLDMWLRQKRL